MASPSTDAPALSAEEEKELRIKTAMNRILAALKIDPFDVLDLKYTAVEADINRAYRNLSLLIHPDKVPGWMKEDAQAAFSKIVAATTDLGDGTHGDAHVCVRHCQGGGGRRQPGMVPRSVVHSCGSDS